MSRMSISMLALMACVHAIPAAGADDTVAMIGPPDCRIANPVPQPDESAQWSGGCKDGYAEGDGVVDWYVGGTLSSRYRGTLVRGRQDGQGEYEHLRAKWRYVGGYRAGSRHGPGRTIQADGLVVQATYDMGRIVGDATVTDMENRRYQGGWRNGKAHGHGRLVQSDGTTYEGGFENGAPSGGGKLAWPDGRTFEGQFGKGQRGTPGVHVGADGSRTEGMLTGAFAESELAVPARARAAGSKAAITSVAGCAPRAEDYPLESQRRNEQGTTRLRFTVGADGTLTKSEIVRSSGHPLLDEAALRHLSACRFKSGTDAQGNATGGSLVIEYVWRLE